MCVSTVVVLLAGYRMPAPEGTPDGVYDVMCRCWAQEPKDRPKFEQIHTDLKTIWLAIKS